MQLERREVVWSLVLFPGIDQTPSEAPFTKWTGYISTDEKGKERTLDMYKGKKVFVAIIHAAFLKKKKEKYAVQYVIKE